jgi:hypothetical protein
MKFVLAAVIAAFATTATASTCEETVAKHPAYASTLEAMLSIYEEGTGFQKLWIKYQHKLEIEALCEVKENKKRDSFYWSTPGTIKDEDYFKLAIEWYEL